MSLPFIDLMTQYLHVEVEIHSRIQKVLDHDSYIMGRKFLNWQPNLPGFVVSNMRLPALAEQMHLCSV